ARGLERGRQAALALYAKITAGSSFLAAFPPELDIVVFAPRAASVSELCVRSREIFAAAAEKGLHLAVADLPSRWFPELDPVITKVEPRATCLRSVLMKPEHLDWIDRIWAILCDVSAATGGRANAT